MTIREAITAASTQLAHNEALRDNATRDAELLLLHTLSISRATLLAHPERTLAPTEILSYHQAIHRRGNAEPIQYITGTQEFFGLPFHVSPAVLIPRPETELLVESVLERLPPDQPLRIADVGTGSGILAITLALHLPLAELTAIDLSPAALAVSQRIHLLQSDLLAAAPSAAFDAIVSNPPYIPDSDRATLHPQVRDFEPASALFAGPNGLDIYSRLIPQASDALRPGGLLALEIGFGQASEVRQLLSNWNQIQFLEDLQQIPRVALARKPAESR
jgi:release factor glutamine methyltransferase